MHTKRSAMLLVVGLTLAPVRMHAQEAEATGPREQNFVITAYYSPLPDQCCYVKGSYEADVILNGKGTNGADGAEVYPGMLAAPPTYAFGTRVELPGIGTLTVHDRGGAIQELNDTHRLDIWMGAGEEGLARALAFGVQEVRGIVYPPGTAQPAESLVLEKFPAPEQRLMPYFVTDNGVLGVHASAGQEGFSVTMLQEHLQTLGYFNHEPTGLFGEVTQSALAAFIADMGLSEPSTELTKITAAYLTAALEQQSTVSPVAFIGKESSPIDIMKAQRTLRYLGYYRGRTNGAYSSTLFNAILSYQRDHSLVGTAASPGAGRIGPLTKGALDNEIRRKRIARRAKILMLFARIRDLLEEKQLLVKATMQQGSAGKNVFLLQAFLASQGFFPESKINGYFGPLTAESVAKFQIARGLLQSMSDKGAGTIGPVTLRTIRQEKVQEMYKVVRAEGLEAL